MGALDIGVVRVHLGHAVFGNGRRLRTLRRALLLHRVQRLFEVVRAVAARARHFVLRVELLLHIFITARSEQ